MSSMIYNPLEEFDSKFKDMHIENTNKHFSELVSRSGIDIEENRKTVKSYEDERVSLKKIQGRYNLWRFFRVIMIISLILIPLVIFVITPKIRAMRTEMADKEKKIAELLSLCYKQMQPLNSLFSDLDAIGIIEKTIPGISISPSLSVEMERNMIENFDFSDNDEIGRAHV